MRFRQGQSEKADDLLVRGFDSFEYAEGDELVLPAADDYVRKDMPAVLLDVESEYLKDELDGVDTLIQMASGTQPEFQ